MYASSLAAHAASFTYSGKDVTMMGRGTDKCKGKYTESTRIEQRVWRPCPDRANGGAEKYLSLAQTSCDRSPDAALLLPRESDDGRMQPAEWAGGKSDLHKPWLAVLTSAEMQSVGYLPALVPADNRRRNGVERQDNTGFDALTAGKEDWVLLVSGRNKVKGSIYRHD